MGNLIFIKFIIRCIVAGEEVSLTSTTLRNRTLFVLLVESGDMAMF